MPKILHYYRETEPPHSLLLSLKEQLESLALFSEVEKIQNILTETCFNVQIEGSEILNDDQSSKLEWLLAETFEKIKLRLEESAFSAASNKSLSLEFGPRMTFTSAFSSNAVSICHACSLTSITRLEKSRRYHLKLTSPLSEEATTVIKSVLHDRMTEQSYPSPISTFKSDVLTQQVTTIPIMKDGRKALEKVNAKMGLGFDDFDLDYYTDLFKVIM